MTASASLTRRGFLGVRGLEQIVGGAVAETIGRSLRRLGKERQVLCVTHLPQVASQANQHFQVAKGTTVRVLEGYSNKYKILIQTATVTTVGTDPQEWVTLTYVEFALSHLAVL